MSRALLNHIMALPAPSHSSADSCRARQTGLCWWGTGHISREWRFWVKLGKKDIIVLVKSVSRFTSKTLVVSVDESSVNNSQCGSDVITNWEINKKCLMFENLNPS